MKMFRTCALLIGCLAASATAHAAIYDETANGDLSDNRLSPTLFAIGTGANSISGFTEAGDLDYVTFTVPVGWNLSSIFHRTYVSNDFRAFIGLQEGSTFTESADAPNPANLLGYRHIGIETVNSEIIDDLATSNLSTPPAMGFVGPLGAGNYTFWIQQTGAGSAYAFDLMLTPVPEPQQWMLMLAGALLLASRARKLKIPSLRCHGPV